MLSRAGRERRRADELLHTLLPGSVGVAEVCRLGQHVSEESAPCEGGVVVEGDGAAHGGGEPTEDGHPGLYGFACGLPGEAGREGEPGLPFTRPSTHDPLFSETLGEYGPNPLRRAPDQAGWRIRSG